MDEEEERRNDEESFDGEIKPDDSLDDEVDLGIRKSGELLDIFKEVELFYKKNLTKMRES